MSTSSTGPDSYSTPPRSKTKRLDLPDRARFASSTSRLSLLPFGRLFHLDPPVADYLENVPHLVRRRRGQADRVQLQPLFQAAEHLGGAFVDLEEAFLLGRAGGNPVAGRGQVVGHAVLQHCSQVLAELGGTSVF